MTTRRLPLFGAQLLVTPANRTLSKNVNPIRPADAFRSKTRQYRRAWRSSGAKTFDRLFAGIRFDERDGPLLYVYAKDEETAAEIEDNFALHIATIASGILKREIEIVLVLPKVLQ